MLKIDRDNQSFSLLDTPTLADVSITERYDLQEFICNTPEYYREQLEAQRESYLRKRILHYKIDGKRRWFAAARQARSYVWQHGRFDEDIEYWQHGLSDSTAVKPVKEGKCLRFFLATKDDFEFFHQAATEKLITTEWMLGSPEEELDEVETEE